PMLLAWGPPIDLGFTFPDAARRTGTALAAVPVRVERPAPGTRVLIPAPFLGYRAEPLDAVFRQPYDPARNRWASEMTSPARALLRFQDPRELLPLRVERAVLHIAIHAPERPFELLGRGPTGLEVLARRHSPVGRLRLVIDRGDALQPDAGGGVRVGIAVG